MSFRHVILWCTLALVLLAANALIVREEAVLRAGRTIYLELLPYEPWMIQETDMRLHYVAARQLRDTYPPWEGSAVLRLDERRVGSFVRVYVDGEALADNELLLDYRWGGTGITFGQDQFTFETGQADLFAQARYAEVLVTERRTVFFRGLYDANLNELKPG